MVIRATRKILMGRPWQCRPAYQNHSGIWIRYNWFTKEDLLDPDNIIHLGYEPNQIDLIIQLDEVDFKPCFAQRQEADFEGLPINFIHFDDLLKNKLATGRKLNYLIKGKS